MNERTRKLLPYVFGIGVGLFWGVATFLLFGPLDISANWTKTEKWWVVAICIGIWIVLLILTGVILLVRRFSNSRDR